MKCAVVPKSMFGSMQTGKSPYFDHAAWLSAKQCASDNFWHAGDQAFKDDPWAGKECRDTRVVIWKDDTGEFCASAPLTEAELRVLVETPAMQPMRFLTHDLLPVTVAPEL
jgi:hypothetical protein